MSVSSRLYRRLNPRGFVGTVYDNMFRRVTGRTNRAHLYQGLTLLPRPVFCAWALAEISDFWPLWTRWQATGRSRKLVPSIDRKDVLKGYSLENMRWRTLSENSRYLTNRFHMRGEAHACTHLKDDQIRFIRQSSLSCSALGKKFGVARNTVADIRRKRTWRHVE